MKTISPPKTGHITLLVLFSLRFLGAQETTPEDPQTPMPETPVIYVIRNIAFDIKGVTRPFALRYHGKFTEGELLKGQEALDFYIQYHTQLLVNQRVLNKDARITYTLGPAEPDGAIPVDLLVSVSDTWNIIVLPKPRWNSNDGFDLTLKGRDYNFFGTMAPLRIDFGYRLNTKNESSFTFLLDTDIPFTALGFNWNIDFDNEFNYTWQEALGYTNTAGLSMDLPWRHTTFTFDAVHTINWYPKNEGRNEDEYGKFFEGLYNSICFGVEWNIPTGIRVSDYGSLSYTPRVSQNFTYRPGTWDTYEWDASRRSLSTSLDQTLGFGQINWIGNFRRGLGASFENTNSYDYIRHNWNNYYALTASGHFLFDDFFGIASRLRFRHWLSAGSLPYENAGDVLRGIKNNQIQAGLMLSLNLEFPFRVWTARPSDWFDSPKMRIFNVEFFLSPILDIGLVHLPRPTSAQQGLTAYYTGGVELFIFPEAMRSLYLCLSVGFDLEQAAKTGRPFSGFEFSLDLGHFFD